MDHQNPYVNAERDMLLEQIVESMSTTDFADVSREFGEQLIRNECYKQQIFEWKYAAQVIKSVWIRIDNDDPCKLPSDFFNPNLYPKEHKP